MNVKLYVFGLHSDWNGFKTNILVFATYPIIVPCNSSSDFIVIVTNASHQANASIW